MLVGSFLRPHRHEVPDLHERRDAQSAIDAVALTGGRPCDGSLGAALDVEQEQVHRGTGEPTTPLLVGRGKHDVDVVGPQRDLRAEKVVEALIERRKHPGNLAQPLRKRHR